MPTFTPEKLAALTGIAVAPGTQDAIFRDLPALSYQPAGAWEGFTLSDRNRLQILIPPKFGNGHIVLSDMAIFHYKQNSMYNRAGQFTLLWNDPTLNLWWPIADPIVSQRDGGVT